MVYANVVTDRTGGYTVDLLDEHGILLRRVAWTNTRWGARRVARRRVRREEKRRERGSSVVDVVRSTPVVPLMSPSEES